MAVSYVTYTGDGSTTQYVITFEYISRDDVVVQVNDVNAAFTFINDTTVEITNTPSSGDKINIKRETPLTPLVDFADGSTLFESDLDLSAKQSRYLASEARDRADEAIAFIDTNINDVITVSNIATDVVTVSGQISPTNNIQTLAEIQDGTTATNAISTAASISTAISNVSSISSAVSTVSSDSVDVQTLAGISADIQTLADIEDGTIATDAISDVAAIATNVSTVSGISTEVTNVAGKLTEIERLGTADAVADLAILGTTDAVADMNTLAAISTDIEAVADKASFITADFVSDLNTLATTDVVADLNTLATSDIVADINLLAQTDVIADLNTLATTDIVSDLNTLATTDIVADLNQLATSDFVSDLNTMATTTNVTNLATVAGDITNINAVAADATDIGVVASDLAGSDTIGTVAGGLTNINTVASDLAGSNNIGTVATNITGVNSFAERYRVGTADPTTDLDEGDLFFNTTSNEYKFYDGSNWQVVNVSGLGSIIEDTTPQLGGNLDTNGNEISFDDGSDTTNRLTFGADEDLQIYFDGSKNVITGNGLDTTTDTHIFVNDNFYIRKGTPYSSEIMASFNGDQGVALNYNNSQRLTTSSTGVTVSGDLTTTDDLFVNGGFGRISSSITPILELRNTDTTAQTDQELGVIDFYGSDSSGSGAGVKASIKSVAKSSWGSTGDGSEFEFYVTQAGGWPNEELRATLGSYYFEVRTRSGMRLFDEDQTGYVNIIVPDDVPSWYNLILPSAGPSANDQIIVSDTNGYLSFEDKPTAGGTAFSAF